MHAVLHAAASHGPLPCLQPLPWRLAPPGTKRAGAEAVRPVVWANRPRAYLKRTQAWQSFPSGRWADVGSPRYGALTDHRLVCRHTGGSAARRARARAAWGEALSGLEDVQAVFARSGHVSSNAAARNVLHCDGCSTP